MAFFYYGITLYTKIDFALAPYLCHVIRKAQGNDGRNKVLR